MIKLTKVQWGVVVACVVWLILYIYVATHPYRPARPQSMRPRAAAPAPAPAKPKAK